MYDDIARHLTECDTKLQAELKNLGEKKIDLGVARPIMEKIPYAWVFFIFFILIATFIVINLFIAVIVDSLNNLDTDPRDPLQHAKLIHKELIELKDQFSKQQQQLEELTKLLATNNKQHQR